MDYKAMGRRIRAQRKLLGLTQEQLAAVLDISNSFMGHIERGTRAVSLETLVKIANALNISCDVLLQDSLTSRDDNATMGLNENNLHLLREIANVLREYNSDTCR